MPKFICVANFDDGSKDNDGKSKSFHVGHEYDGKSSEQALAAGLVKKEYALEELEKKVPSQKKA